MPASAGSPSTGPLRRALGWVERRPLLVLLVPALLALGAIAGLADIAGSERLDRAEHNIHPEWLVLCFFGELAAYAGYVLAVRDTAKVDNGLGDLPHYRDWIDPTGRAPMEPVVTAEDATRWP